MANIAPVKLDERGPCVWCLGMTTAPGRPLGSRGVTPRVRPAGTQHQLQQAKLGSWHNLPFP